MIEFNEEYKSKDREFYLALGERIPSRMLPSKASNEEVFAIVDSSIEAGVNLFPEKYGYKEKPNSTVF